LLSLKEGKEYQAVLPLLKPICSRLILTTFNLIQELPAQSIDLKVLEQAARDLDFPDLQTIEDPVEAYKTLLAAPEEVLVITGSFYLLSCVRPLIIQT
jgi:folylpolyglutamate synthase/dihydropteroate synthase